MPTDPAPAAFNPPAEDLELPADPDPAAADPAAYTPVPNIVADLGQLTGMLCEAVGLDPNDVHGFRLTVMGGVFPQLEVWQLPPHTDQGDLTDEWVAPLAARMADTTHVILPGVGASVPPAQPRPLPLMAGVNVPDHLQPDLWLAERLTQMADAINGAPLSADDRDALTAQAHYIAETMAARVYDGTSPGASRG